MELKLKFHLCSTLYFFVITVIIAHCCVLTEASDYDGKCTANSGCTDTSIADPPFKSNFEFLSSFASNTFNKVLSLNPIEYAKSFAQDVTDTINPKIIVWIMWETVFEMAEDYIPFFLSIVLLTIGFIINVIMWKVVNVPLLRILQFNAVLYLAYAFFGPKNVIKCFSVFLSYTYLLLYTMFVPNYRVGFAIVFLFLPFYQWWIWIPPKIMVWMLQLIPIQFMTSILTSLMSLVPTKITNKLPSWKTICEWFCFSTENEVERRLRNIEETQKKILNLLETRKKKGLFSS